MLNTETFVYEPETVATAPLSLSKRFRSEFQEAFNNTSLESDTFSEFWEKYISFEFLSTSISQNSRSISFKFLRIFLQIFKRDLWIASYRIFASTDTEQN